MTSTDSIAWFADIGLDDRPRVGGKGANLGELTRAGLPAPPGFVVATAAFERFLAALEAEAPVRAKVEALDVSNLAAVDALSAELLGRFEGAALPDDVSGALAAAHARLVEGLGDAHVAVRSSATSEDAADASFAGLQDTYLWAPDVDAVDSYLRRCWASLYSTPAITYRRKNGVPESGAAMGVVVQVMVNSRAAGVMFTRSPTSGDRSVVTIEGAWGLGSSVVSGEVTPDRFVMGKVTGEITARDISEKRIEHVPAAAGGVDEVAVPEDRVSAPCVSDEELSGLLDLAKRVESHYGAPQDIEWAIARDDAQLWLLQSRPETVWANREDAPVATAHDAAHHHVMRIFGGRR